MPVIRVVQVPGTDVALRPSWVGKEMVGISIPINEKKSNEKLFSVRPQDIIDGLKVLGRIEAADWWELYFLYRSCKDGREPKTGYMLFRALDCDLLP